MLFNEPNDRKCLKFFCCWIWFFLIAVEDCDELTAIISVTEGGGKPVRLNQHRCNLNKCLPTVYYFN